MLFGLESVGLTAGQRIVIQGGLGLNAIAKDKGAEVTIIDSVPHRLALTEQFGADHVIDMTDHPTPEQRIARVLGRCWVHRSPTGAGSISRRSADA